MRTPGLVFVLCAVVSILGSGCASSEIDNLNERLVSLEEVSKKPPNATYIIEPPDTIQVQVMGEPGATTEAQVRQDGIVNLAHLGETKVAPMTTEELRKKLEKEYEEYFKEPEVKVQVTGYNSKSIYVYGEVNNPGPQEYTGFQTLSEAIGDARGVTRRADYNEVKVVRADPEEPEVYWADLNKLIYEGKAKQDVSLAPSDVVYVRPSALAWVGYQVEKLMFPFQSLFSGVRTYETVENVFGSNRYD